MNKYYSRHFNVSFQLKSRSAVLSFEALDKIISTRKLEKTHLALSKIIPTIFENECFNYEKQSFFDESKDTEVAHLLEHLILENLKILKLRSSEKALFKGLTTWNWNKNPYGTFEIKICSPSNFQKYFQIAFWRSSLTLHLIYEMSLNKLFKDLRDATFSSKETTLTKQNKYYFKKVQLPLKSQRFS